MRPGNPFEGFFGDRAYLELKNHLYNYRIRRRAVRRAMEAVPEGPVLEIGSGISPIMDGREGVLFSDLSPQALGFLRARHGGVRAAAMDASHLACREGVLSAVVCSEVLEHVDDDREALREMRRVLSPGGTLVLTVPLHSYFFWADDACVGHKRRYAPGHLVETLGRAGFGEFKCVRLMGLLEKVAMLGAVHFFRGVRRLFRTPAREGSPGGSLLRLGLPFYKGLNALYGLLVRAEACLIPMALCSVVMIRCRKQQEGAS